MRFFPQYDYLVTWQALISTSAAYLLLILTLKKFMQDRKPLELKGVMRVYNLIQVILSASMVYGLSR